MEKAKNKTVKCKYEHCDFSGRSDNVKRHEDTHDPDRMWHICDECGTKLSTKGALTRHKIHSCQQTTVKDKVAPPTVESIHLNDIAKLEHLITLKNGTTIRVAGMVSDIHKILCSEGTIHDCSLYYHLLKQNMKIIFFRKKCDK